jgi:hypothetical protein
LKHGLVTEAQDGLNFRGFDLVIVPFDDAVECTIVGYCTVLSAKASYMILFAGSAEQGLHDCGVFFCNDNYECFACIFCSLMFAVDVSNAHMEGGVFR